MKADDTRHLSRARARRADGLGSLPQGHDAAALPPGAAASPIFGAGKRRKPRAKELPLHKSAAQYLRAAWPLPFTHFPAGELRNARTGRKLKEMGVAPGWPDFILLLPNGRVAFIELKAPGGKLSDTQVAFRDQVISSGGLHAVATSPQEVEEVCVQWLSSEGLSPRARITA